MSNNDNCHCGSGSQQDSETQQTESSESGIVEQAAGALVDAYTGTIGTTMDVVMDLFTAGHWSNSDSGSKK